MTPIAASTITTMSTGDRPPPLPPDAADDVEDAGAGPSEVEDPLPDEDDDPPFDAPKSLAHWS